MSAGDIFHNVRYKAFLCLTSILITIFPQLFSTSCDRVKDNLMKSERILYENKIKIRDTHIQS